MQLEQEDLDKDNQCFGSRQKEDDHSLRIDRERAELEDRSAERRCFNASTDDGITFRNLLAKDVEGASDVKGFEKARQMSLGLEVHKAFKEQTTGLCNSIGGSGCHSQVQHREHCCQFKTHG